MLNILRMKHASGDLAVGSLDVINKALTLGPYELPYHRWKEARGEPSTLPRNTTTPLDIRLWLDMGVFDMEHRSKIFSKIFELVTAQGTAAHVASKGVDAKKIWEQVDYFLYRWQKTIDPTAIKPFTKGTDQLEEDFENLRDWFERGEAIEINHA